MAHYKTTALAAISQIVKTDSSLVKDPWQLEPLVRVNLAKQTLVEYAHREIIGLIDGNDEDYTSIGVLLLTVSLFELYNVHYETTGNKTYAVLVGCMNVAMKIKIDHHPGASKFISKTRGSPDGVYWEDLAEFEKNLINGCFNRINHLTAEVLVYHVLTAHYGMAESMAVFGEFTSGYFYEVLSDDCSNGWSQCRIAGEVLYRFLGRFGLGLNQPTNELFAKLKIGTGEELE